MLLGLWYSFLSSQILASVHFWKHQETLSGVIMTLESVWVIYSPFEIHLSCLTINKGPFGGFIDTLWYRTRNYRICLSSAAKCEASVLLQEWCSLWQVNQSFIRNYILHCQNKLTTLLPPRHFMEYGKGWGVYNCKWCTTLSIHSDRNKIFWNKWLHELRICLVIRKTPCMRHQRGSQS